LLAIAGGVARAAVLNVSTDGVDALTCGTKVSPCRSICQAIANAGAGDKILVGPGRYGDLNGNGMFGEAGEERAEIGVGCQCLIHLKKPLTLTSRDGAGVTVFDAGGAAISVVQIDANDVVFGAPKKGFMVTGGAGMRASSAE